MATPIEVTETNGFTIYSVETPGGQRWSFDEEDLNAAYIEDTLWAWSRLLDFVNAKNDE